MTHVLSVSEALEQLFREIAGFLKGQQATELEKPAMTEQLEALENVVRSLPVESYAELGQYLRTARLTAGLTQQQAAARLCKSPSYVSRIERGSRRPSATSLVALARAYDLHTDHLLRLAGSVRFDFLSALAEEEAGFETGRRYYREHFEELLAEYSGKYIAVMDDQVVDSDPSFHELATRVYAKYGYRDIFMPKVVRDRVVTVSGPRRR